MKKLIKCVVFLSALVAATGKDGMYILYGRNLMEVWRIVPTEKRMDFVRQCVFGNIPKPTVVTFVMEMTSTIPSVANLPRQPHIISADSDGKNQIPKTFS